ncbi:hypothetical protein E2C06_25725 [Dankookia rubra]|uniref:D-isomer specific 2-hydroxyacid dehydrogenase NAD-binding domain-containing protein n=1 Tax=Dankookia rubra TaxID=1442381 RepID=A0A4R5Q9Q2_9PROT|nr:NAD(P)-dependent oxidoreductase [Dankookia rubra]TDH59740.1 hypothetical protein E2C06_25725 [Dankookia rubra]
MRVGRPQGDDRQLERQRIADPDVHPQQVRAVGAEQAQALFATADMEGRRLGGAGHECLRHRHHMRPHAEGLGVDRAEPQHLRVQPVSAVLGSCRVAMRLQRDRGIVDETALLDALDAGHLAWAGVDVFEKEPLDLASPLRGHPRVLPTPHLAPNTPRGAVGTAESIVVLAGRQPALDGAIVVPGSLRLAAA